ncbi:class I SAM-dependent methyltransferase [Consotaella aegiceratis]|uniref:class I SAM-dependent methyltransferase n=1 Tax=Consotaella aegiceratis TaxID=3097961 RepID=UPI002F3F0D02
MIEENTSERFWERRYQEQSSTSSGRPSAALTRFVEGRASGRALELGCAKGDDAVWLARQGWTVTAVDVSQTALGYARSNAETAGVADRIRFERHDLGQSFPDGTFDLVTACYLQSPVEFPRAAILRRAAAAVAPGGMLLIATHGSVAPWSRSDPNTVFSTAEEEFEQLDLDPEAWERVFVGSSEREARHQDGRTAKVLDIGVVLTRR